MSSIAKTIRIDSLDKNVDDIEVIRGSYLQIDYTAYQSDGSTAVALTDATIRFTIYDIEAEANEAQLKTQAVTAGTWLSDVVTFTAAAHGFAVDDVVTVGDCGNSSYDGSYTVVSVATNTFTAALTPDPGAFTTNGQVNTAEIEITTAASGLFSVYLTDDETDTDGKTYLYDIHLVLTGGTEHHAASGKLRIYPTAYTGP